MHENGSPEMKIFCFSMDVLYLNTYRDIKVKWSLVLHVIRVSAGVSKLNARLLLIPENSI